MLPDNRLLLPAGSGDPDRELERDRLPASWPAMKRERCVCQIEPSCSRLRSGCTRLLAARALGTVGET